MRTYVVDAQRWYTTTVEAESVEEAREIALERSWSDWEELTTPDFEIEEE